MPDPLSEEPDDAPLRIPITGEIDLHTFRPSEIGSLLPEYFRECRLKGILLVRVVHGKGTGTLREGVWSLLQSDEAVQSYRCGREHEGSWGATMVQLRPWSTEDSPD